MTSKLRLPTPEETYSQRNEAETRREIELLFLKAPSGGAGLPSRRTITFTTASLAAGATEQGTINILAGGVTMRTIGSDRACRLRFFATAAVQSSDNSRAYTSAPQAGIGVELDAIWLTTHTKIITPTLELFNADSPVTGTIYYTIENLSGATGTVTITMTVVDSETL